MFSRISRALSSSPLSAFSKKLVYSTGCNGLKSVASSELGSQARIVRGDSGLRFVRTYLTSIRPGKEIANNGFSFEFNSVFLNPRLRRLFCNEAPKKRNYENYYPKNKKEIPKGKNQKAEAKDESSAGEQGNSQDPKSYEINLLVPFLLLSFVLSSTILNPREQKQISFQEFKTKLLEPGLVDCIVVSNKSVAKVYVKESSPGVNQTSNDGRDPINGTSRRKSSPGMNQTANDGQDPINGNSRRNASRYKYYFTIGSVDTFEEKLVICCLCSSPPTSI